MFRSFERRAHVETLKEIQGESSSLSKESLLNLLNQKYEFRPKISSNYNLFQPDHFRVFIWTWGEEKEK